MSYNLQEVQEGAIGTRLADPGVFEVLWANGESRAGVYIPAQSMASGYIIAEVCSYNPMPRRWFDDENDAPFHTDADQLLVDLHNVRYAQQYQHYEEGEVQGIVYAVDAIKHGGTLDPASYRAIIKNWANEFEAEANDKRLWRPLADIAVVRYAELGFIL